MKTKTKSKLEIPVKDILKMQEYLDNLPVPVEDRLLEPPLTPAEKRRILKLVK